MLRLAGVAAAKDVDYGERDDAQVEPQRPVFNVVEIIPDSLLQVRVAPQIIDLRPSGDARLDKVLLHVAGDLLAESADEFGPLRSWPHDRHLSPENIDELRE